MCKKTGGFFLIYQQITPSSMYILQRDLKLILSPHTSCYRYVRDGRSSDRIFVIAFYLQYW
jgi:hypothetical protein